MSSVLVIQLARLGDFVQSIPLIKTMGKEFDQVDLITSFDPGQRLGALVDHLAILNPVDFLREFQPSEAFQKLLRALQPLPKGLQTPYDAVYCLNDSEAALSLAACFRGSNLRGMAGSASSLPLWMRSLVRDRRGNRLNLSTLFSLSHSSTLPPLPRQDQRMLGNTSKLGQVLIHPGSGHKARQLPLKFWRSLVQDLLSQNPERTILLTGTASEQSFCEQVMPENFNDSVQNLAGKTSLDELQTLFDASTLLIAQDTGVLHLAAYAGLKILGLYHASAQAWETAPAVAGSHVLQTDMLCHPCVEGASDCDDFPCKDVFTSDIVGNLARWLLRDGSVPPPLLPAGLDHFEVQDLEGLCMLRAFNRDSSWNQDNASRLLQQYQLFTAKASSPQQGPFEHHQIRSSDRVTWRKKTWFNEPKSVEEHFAWEQEELAFHQKVTPQNTMNLTSSTIGEELQ